MHMNYENLTPQYRIEEYLEAIVEGWVDATVVAYPEVPSWRIEEFLDAFITYIWEDGDHPRHPCPEPAWRLEECLRAIYDVMTGAATPWPFPLPTTNSIEEYLAAIHAYLADGTELPVPEPVWRIEQWLAYALDAVKQGGGVATTVSGTMVHITNALAKAALSVLAHISPIQDLHGYDHPWPAGGGKNKCVPDLANGQIGSNGGYSSNTARVTNAVLINGLYLSNTYLPAGTYTLSIADLTQCTVITKDSSGNTIDNFATAWHNLPYTFTMTAAGYVLFTGRKSSGDLNPDDYKAQIESGSTATSWEPYENLCPISGRTGLSVYVGPTQDQQDATTYSVDWTSEAGTVYGGTPDVVTGLLTDKMGNITVDDFTNFVNGSSRGGLHWVEATVSVNANAEAISSMLEWKATRTAWESATECFATENGKVRVYTSASSLSDFKTRFADLTVVYELATPLTYQLTAQEVQMLLGENYVWSSSGDTVSVTYYAEGNANPLQSLNILLGGNYSNPKTADDVSDKEALEIILGGNK